MRKLLQVEEVTRPLTTFEKFLGLRKEKKSLSKNYQLLIEQEHTVDWSQRACYLNIGCELSNFQWPLLTCGATRSPAILQLENIIIRYYIGGTGPPIRCLRFSPLHPPCVGDVEVRVPHSIIFGGTVLKYKSIGKVLPMRQCGYWGS